MPADLESASRVSLDQPERKTGVIGPRRSEKIHAFIANSELRTTFKLLVAFVVGWAAWHALSASTVTGSAVYFLSTLAVAVTLWISGALDEYVVALLLLLSWLLLEIVPSEVALSGFSKSSWFFAVGALGMAAAVYQSGLLSRLSLFLLKQVPPGHFKTLLFILSGAGLFVTPLLPISKARVSLMAPVSQAISDAFGFKTRSNGSASLVLAAYIGFCQFSFMFLTGASHCLMGWSLLPEPAKVGFGWATWALAALPAGAISFLFLFGALNVLFPINQEEKSQVSAGTIDSKLSSVGKMTRTEWLSLTVAVLAVTGWLTTFLHGIDEAWIALAALVFCLLTHILDRKGFKNNIDWGFLFFLGVTYSLSDILLRLKLDQWFIGFLQPALAAFTFHPTSFLVVVVLLSYLLHLFLRKSPTIILLVLTLSPWALELGIHPGVLLITILLATEGWFLTYQDSSYQIVYYSVEGKAFSHVQALKLMSAKFVSCLLAVVISVPCWKLMGLIK
jgi:anion transporter